MDNRLKGLEDHCTIEPDSYGKETAFRLSFINEGTLVTIRIILDDEQSGADLVITNMTTLPRNMIRRGHGKRALRKMLTCVLANNVRDILATQVQQHNKGFWEGQKFVAENNPTGDFRYIPTAINKEEICPTQ